MISYSVTGTCPRVSATSPSMVKFALSSDVGSGSGVFRHPCARRFRFGRRLSVDGRCRFHRRPFGYPALVECLGLHFVHSAADQRPQADCPGRRRRAVSCGNHPPGLPSLPVAYPHRFGGRPRPARIVLERQGQRVAARRKDLGYRRGSGGFVPCIRIRQSTPA